MDLVQELFEALLRKKSTDADLAYLYRAITNRSLNFLRDRKNQQRLLDHHGETSQVQLRPTSNGDLYSMDLLLQLVRSLDLKSAEILTYHFIDDMTQEEIAALLTVSRRDVGRHLERIRVQAQVLAGEAEVV